MEIGDKFLEKFEENHGKRQTKLLTALFGYALIIGSLLIIVAGGLKLLNIMVGQIFWPIYHFTSALNIERFFQVKSGLWSDIVVAIAAVAVAVFLCILTATLTAGIILWIIGQVVKLFSDGFAKQTSLKHESPSADRIDSSDTIS